MPIHEMPWGGIGGWFMMILWWVLIIAAIIFLVTWITKQTSGGSKERSARGEISKKEFEEKKRDIA